MSGAKLNTIGFARRRVDGRAKVTGQTRFADDVVLARTVHCKLLRSKVPHARIRGVDVAAAERYPGVLLVLTGRDFHPVRHPPGEPGRGSALPRAGPVRR